MTTNWKELKAFGINMDKYCFNWYKGRKLSTKVSYNSVLNKLRSDRLEVIPIVKKRFPHLLTTKVNEIGEIRYDLDKFAKLIHKFTIK